MEFTKHPVDVDSGAYLIIPKYDLPRRNRWNNIRLLRLIEQHSRFYAMAAILPPNKVAKRAYIDVVSVTDCFRAIRDDTTVLAMLAWFAFLCVVDDAVEKLEVTVAQGVLAESIGTLCSADEGPEQVREKLAQALISSDVEIQRITAISKVYRSYLTNLLPQTVRTRMLQASRKVLRAMIEECKSRRKASVSEDQYLDIRKETVGLRPLFVLVKDYFRVGQDSHPSLEDIISHICMAVGMQNDLVGLEKDIAQNENFNYMLRLETPSAAEQQQRITTAAELHNNAVQGALQSREIFQDGKVRACADCMVAFVAKHFRWATASQRYRSGQPMPVKGKIKAAVLTLSAKAFRIKHHKLDKGPS